MPRSLKGAGGKPLPFPYPPPAAMASLARAPLGRPPRIPGNDLPFSDLHLSDALLKAVADSGYTEPTAIQAAAICLALAISRRRRGGVTR